MAQSLPPSFVAKKQKILQQLAVPAEHYDDLSPKGSVDEGIRDLINEINALNGCVTTSSCAGRISVFLEGKKSGSPGKTDCDSVGDGERVEAASENAGVGGKGGGGRWLFVSHEPVDVQKHITTWTELFGMQPDQNRGEELLSLGAARGIRFIHFKFEPMILHVRTASLQQAQSVLSAALQAGFRESGALNLVSSSEPATPMVGIRSMGLALESIIGFEGRGREICIVPEYQLRNLVEVSNDRFKENTNRIERFRSLLHELGSAGPGKGSKHGPGWEDSQTRRERKRAEGLTKSQLMKQPASQKYETSEEIPDLDLLEQNT